MKHISTIISQPPAMKRPMGSDELQKHERDAVAYFFLRLSLLNREQYDRQFPDEKTEALAKREYAAHVKDFSREQIDKGMAAYHDNRQHNVDGYQFLDADRAIGLIRNGGNSEGNPARIHKPFEPLALPDKQAEEKSRKAGASALAEMKGLWSE